MKPINHFSVDQLLQNGWIWRLSHNLSTDQISELNRRAKEGRIIKERAKYPYYSEGSRLRTIYRQRDKKPYKLCFDHQISSL